MPNPDLEKKILDEIAKTGFPLELRVSAWLQDRGYFVANNVYYVDHDEDKGREVDLRALKNYEFKVEREQYYVRHYLLIECKKSSNKPWVIFTSPITGYDKKLYQIDCRGFTDDAIWYFEDGVESLQITHPFTAGTRRGRSYFEPFKNSETSEAIFKALTTSAKATIATRDSYYIGGGPNICFYYPLIIFEGNLYEAYLEDSDIKLNEIESVVISFFYQSSKYKQETFAIPIVTEKALPDFISILDDFLLQLGEVSKDNLDWFQLKKSETKD